MLTTNNLKKIKMSFTITSKNINYLQINPTKDVEELYLKPAKHC